jgi:hypothetical protein
MRNDSKAIVSEKKAHHYSWIKRNLWEKEEGHEYEMNYKNDMCKESLLLELY